MLDSVIANNSAGGTGGGIENQSGLIITDSTIAGNSASTQGGGIDNVGTMESVNATIADNLVDSSGGGGLFAGSTATTLYNTIVAQNNQVVGTFLSPDDIAGTVSPSSIFNLIGVGGAGGMASGNGGNQVDVVNPGLGRLASNGGMTRRSRAAG